jgi:GNAT superfamily N-acetyltransferase
MATGRAELAGPGRGRDGDPPTLTCEFSTGVTTVQVRPILPDDEERLRRFHEHLSPRSVYLRYFYLHPKLSDQEVHRLTHVDYVDRLALVAIDGDRIVAVGRYERFPGTAEAEVAFVVADEFQDHGIGSRLLAMLAAAAASHGITVLVAETLAENRGMIDVFTRAGFPVTTSREGGTVQVRLTIHSDASGSAEGAEPTEPAGRAGTGQPGGCPPRRGDVPSRHRVTHHAPVPASPCLW